MGDSKCVAFSLIIAADTGILSAVSKPYTKQRLDERLVNAGTHSTSAEFESNNQASIMPDMLAAVQSIRYILACSLKGFSISDINDVHPIGVAQIQQMSIE